MLIACPHCGVTLLRVERPGDAEGFVCSKGRAARTATHASLPVGTRVLYHGAEAEIVLDTPSRLRLRLPSPGTRAVEFAGRVRRLKDGTETVIPGKVVELTIPGKEFDIAPGATLEVVS